MKQTKLRGVFEMNGKYYTKSLVPGKTFFDEPVTKVKGNQYRRISPKRSKLAAALAKGCQQFGLDDGSVVLYLGASHGYTPSFMSDIVGAQGLLFCVEFSPSVAKDLVLLCEQRNNMVPLLADATQPDSYRTRITAVDIVYQDIAQREQLKVFLENCRKFLKPGGFAMLALKARSVDATKKPGTIFHGAKEEIERQKDFTLVDYRELEPYEKDHAFFVVKLRND